MGELIKLPSMQKTKNINFCAFLRMNQVHPDDVEVVRRGKAIYCYDMTEEKWGSWKRAFDRSDFIEYANCLNAIKDLAY